MPLIAAGCWQYNTSQAYESLSTALKSGFTMIDMHGARSTLLEPGAEHLDQHLKRRHARARR
eukprot:4462988-Prymnesium_polylepis.1